MVETNDGFASILWQIYYNKDINVIYIATKEEKELIDILLKANLGYIQKFHLTMVEYHLKYSITYYLKSIKENIYYNDHSVYLKLNNDKIFEDDNGNVLYKQTTEYLLLK